ncbi:anti-sigma factor domain-containing protein [uncultured Enterovirga sp.]|uniref:anti-sigma factor n=1 Tax=uncultured Enterovirga sp. TaxID=2026352 RepID=UPI0035CC8844
MIPTDQEARDVLAAEYVLGQLDEAEAREVEAAMAGDPGLARLVLAWESRLLPALDAAVRPASLDPALWPRIERAMGAMSGPGRPRLVATPRRFWNSAPVWRAATALATAAAVLLAVFPVREGAPAEPQTRYFALLQTRDAAGAETGPGWLIQIAEDGTVRSVPLGRTDPGENRSLQLWTLWDQARGPVSLGVLPPGGAVRLPRESLPQIGGGQLFEITLEPQAGSPTGRPTGRILFIGRASPAASQAL